MGYGFNAAEVVLKGDVFIGGVGVFIGQAETNQDARHFKGIVHLGYEGYGTSVADEKSFVDKSLFQGRLSLLENGIVVWSDPRFSGAQNFKFTMDGLGQELSNVLFHELSDFAGILLGYEARGEFGERF